MESVNDNLCDTVSGAYHKCDVHVCSLLFPYALHNQRTGMRHLQKFINTWMAIQACFMFHGDPEAIVYHTQVEWSQCLCQIQAQKSSSQTTCSAYICPLFEGKYLTCCLFQSSRKIHIEKIQIINYFPIYQFINHNSLSVG